ncbi:RibD family protein [Salinarimonas ramus]|uniref:5-amino-6-(5-phosphoribosylamino)uracil reductase n=1 Tax=Salinarimonas ramus TaxID=690164 RepID=A0A917QIK5_9HYPH|nr:RibD family protein [Salinarimonas ramus]GGK52505.1 5-amino-6-(5-phosphoribosylamino)uracil reductase [Salinarimonas ramus]
MPQGHGLEDGGSAASSTPRPDVFSPFAAGRPQAPFVVGQLGQSLDGRIATVTGDSKYINGSAALDHLHAIRARVDAVLVGVGTAIADDPLLTVRRVPGRSPARVVLDPNGRLSPDAAVWRDDGARRVLLRRRRVTAPVPGGVELVAFSEEGTIAPGAIVAALGRLGFGRILVEGGAETVSRFLADGALDRLHVLVSPMLIGSGRPGLVLDPVERIAQALRPRARAYLLEDGDVLFDCDLRAGGEGE